jgi:hypothetical protein
MDEVINEIKELDLNCSEEELQKRNSFCSICERVDSNEHFIPMCSECNCSIAILLTLKVKSCPIGKW